MKLLMIILSLFSLSACSKEGGDFTPFDPAPLLRLTYDVNGATSATAPLAVSAALGTSITLDGGTGLSRSGYTFGGWNLKPDGTGANYAAGSLYSLSSTTTLYAKWNAITINGNSMKITIGNTSFTATLNQSASASAFKAMLPLTLTMNDMNSNEKYAYLSRSLPIASTRPGVIQNGDIMLYGSNTLVLFYLSFSTSYSYTKIGTIRDPSALQSALGSGSAIVKFELQ